MYLSELVWIGAQWGFPYFLLVWKNVKKYFLLKFLFLKSDWMHSTNRARLSRLPQLLKRRRKRRRSGEDRHLLTRIVWMSEMMIKTKIQILDPDRSLQRDPLRARAMEGDRAPLRTLSNRLRVNKALTQLRTELQADSQLNRTPLNLHRISRIKQTFFSWFQILHFFQIKPWNCHFPTDLQNPKCRILHKKCRKNVWNQDGQQQQNSDSLSNSLLQDLGDAPVTFPDINNFWAANRLSYGRDGRLWRRIDWQSWQFRSSASWNSTGTIDSSPTSFYWRARWIFPQLRSWLRYADFVCDSRGNLANIFEKYFGYPIIWQEKDTASPFPTHPRFLKVLESTVNRKLGYF